VQYDIPIATPYKVLATVSSVAASATSVVASATSKVSQVIETPTATAFNWPLLRKIVLRAAGEEGLAERAGRTKDSSLSDSQAISQQIEERMEQAHNHILPIGPQYETRWRTEYTKVNCIDTSGEAFAIYLNLFYLFPLTVLFARFFYKAYVKRTTKPHGASETAKAIGQDARKAEDETKRAIEAAGKRAEDQMRNKGAKAQQKTRDLVKEFEDDWQKVKESGKFDGRRVSQVVESFEHKFQQITDSIGDVTSPASTPKKSPKKKNNNKKNKQGGGDGDDSRPSTSQENNAADKKSNEADVHDELKPKVDLEDSKSNTETSSNAPKSSEKENQQESQQAPATPERKKNKNAGSKKESAPVDESQGGLFSPLRDDKSAEKSDEKSDEKSGKKSDEKSAAETEKVPAQDESAAKQDANLEASEPTRPAPEEEDEEPESASSSPSASTFIDYAEAVKSGELPEGEEKKDDDAEEEESTETASK
jgi:hypothetical protein